MIHAISIKTKFGWISVFESGGKIIRIKFGKTKKQAKNKILVNFRKNLISFFNKKTLSINAPHFIKGNKTQKNME